MNKAEYIDAVLYEASRGSSHSEETEYADNPDVRRIRELYSQNSRTMGFSEAARYARIVVITEILERKENV